MQQWRDDVIYLTELVLVLNHKIWQHYKTNVPVAQLYGKLWREAMAWAYNNLAGEDIRYFRRTLD